MPKPEPSKDKPVLDKSRDWVKYSGLGFQMVGITCAFVFAGVWLDGHFGTDPVWTLILSLTGVAAGLYSALRDFL